MKLGDKGENVKTMQRGLTTAGFAVTVDGDFGPATEKAVRQFQSSRGLLADGVAGFKTLSALNAAISDKLKPEVKPLPVKERLTRAWFWTTQKAKYVLGAGGRSPWTNSPLTTKDGKLGSDCIGFALWATGLDRYQPKLFTYYDGWMNTDSIIDDAKSGVGGGRWKLLSKPQVGCLVIFPSLWKNGKMIRMGHVGLVVEVPGEWPDDFAQWSAKERTNLLKLVKVIDCNASLRRRISGNAIGQLTAASSWDKPDAVWVVWATDYPNAT